MSHWAEQYIGIPWQAGGRGPDAYDCWGLLLHVMRRHYGRSIQDCNVSEIEAGELRRLAGEWRPVDAPRDGDGVKMGSAERLHVGVYVNQNGGAVLHCAERYGVILTQVSALRSMGFSPVTYYRWQGL